MTDFINRMPKLVKESDGDEKNCGKKRQQPASSKGKGQKKQKTLAANTRKSPVLHRTSIGRSLFKAR